MHRVLLHQRLGRMLRSAPQRPTFFPPIVKQRKKIWWGPSTKQAVQRGKCPAHFYGSLLRRNGHGRAVDHMQVHENVAKEGDGAQERGATRRAAHVRNVEQDTGHDVHQRHAVHERRGEASDIAAELMLVEQLTKVPI